MTGRMCCDPWSGTNGVEFDWKDDLEMFEKVDSMCFESEISSEKFYSLKGNGMEENR